MESNLLITKSMSLASAITAGFVMIVEALSL